MAVNECKLTSLLAVQLDIRGGRAHGGKQNELEAELNFNRLKLPSYSDLMTYWYGQRIEHY